MALTLVSLLSVSAPVSAGDRVLLEQPLSKTICPGKDLKVPGGGFDQYIWYGGPDVEEIELDANENPFVGGAPLQKLEPNPTTEPKLAASRFKGRNVVYLRKMLGSAGSFKSRFTKIKITRAKPPKITIESADEVERGEKVELKTKEDFKKHAWKYLGIPVRAQKAITKRASEPGKWRCVMVKDGRIQDCPPAVWTGALAVTDAMGFLQVKVRDRPIWENLGDEKTAAHHPLLNGALYGVEVTDSNGCAGAKFRRVAVDQHALDLIAGVDFARRDKDPEPAATSATSTDPTTTDPPTTQQPGDLFSNSAGFVGVRWRQYVRNFLGVYGDTRFGGANVSAKDAKGDPTAALVQADTFQADFGLFYDIACGPSTQVCFYTKGELGIIVPENDVVLSPDGTTVEKRVDDQLLRSFAGVGWRYHKPDSIFHRTYTEVGWGRSENFSDSRDRYKLRAEAFFDLTNTWDIFLRGEIDNDGGSGPDDLRVVFGASRDLSFLGEVLVNVLGLGEKKKEDKK